MDSELLNEFQSKRLRISPDVDVVKVPDPHIHKDMFDLGISAHMHACGSDVKSSILVDAYLLTNVDKESQLMALPLSSYVDFEEALAFPKISNCEDCFSSDKPDDGSIVNVLHKSKCFEETQANEL